MLLLAVPEETKDQDEEEYDASAHLSRSDGLGPAPEGEPEYGGCEWELGERAVETHGASGAGMDAECPVRMSGVN